MLGATVFCVVMIGIAAAIRLAYLLSATLRGDLAAAFRAARREFRNRRWYRRVRANITVPF